MTRERRFEDITMEHSERPRSRRPRLAAVAVIGVTALALTGCEGIKEELGLKQKPPDEFSVVTKAPLVMPPDFSLRPPEPGVARPQELSARKAAQSTVFGAGDQPAAGDGARTDGEKALLTLAGADGIDSGIRRTVNVETARMEEDNDSFLDTVIFWREPQKASYEVVDPVKEARRIRENAAAGRPINDGDTATIKRRE